MAAHPELHALHLCSGYGGFELALRSVARVRTVCHVERDAYAAAVLVERMDEARLDQAPVWDDVVTFDGRPWRGRVDLVTAGIPCQPFSFAGRQRGLDDDRWLWPVIARIIDDVRPSIVIVENVPGFVRHGLAHVLADLAGLGFDAEWGLLAASAVGAPHRRQRLWIMAYTGYDTRCSGRLEQSGRTDAQRASEDVGHANGARRPEVAGSLRPVVRPPHCWPPCRDDEDGWRQWIAEGGPEPVIRRGTDGPPVGLADALHLGGNGLVPQCAAAAIRALAARAG